jgi:excisionase family DNA binding protein
VKPLLTEAEVAALLRCSQQTVARLRYAGKLAYIPGRPVKIRQEDFDRWLVCNRGKRIGWAAKREPKPKVSYGRPTNEAEAEEHARMMSLLVRLRRHVR